MPSADGAREDRYPEDAAGPVAEGRADTAPDAIPGGPPPGGTWPHSLSHEPLLRVSDVLNAVGNEFPALTLSKLRFLDTQGLVCPRRTGGGYRHYSPADVERLRFVLRQQRDHYRPLTVIAERLDALDRGEEHEGIAPREVGEGEPRWMSADQLAARAGTDAETVALLVSEGIVQEGLPGRFPRADVEVARAAGEYLEAGGDVRALRAVRHAAAQEADRLKAAVAPLRAKGEREEAGEVVGARSHAATRLFAAVVARDACD